MAKREFLHCQLYVRNELYVHVLTVWCSCCVVLRPNVYHVAILCLPGGGRNTGAVNHGSGIHSLS